MVKSLRRCSAVKSARLHTPTELSVGPRHQSPLTPSNHSPVVIKSPFVVIMSYMAPAPRVRSIQLLGTAVPTHAVPLVHVDNPPPGRAQSSSHQGDNRCTPARYTATARTTSPSSCAAVTSSTRLQRCSSEVQYLSLRPPPPRNASTSHWVPTIVYQCSLHEGLSFSVSF
jgi:hypothetical protein